MKKHCHLSKNVTMGLPEFSYKSIIHLENGQLKGYLGDIINEYLELNRPGNKCKVVLGDSFGRKVINSTGIYYTGFLNLLKEVIFIFIYLYIRHLKFK